MASRIGVILQEQGKPQRVLSVSSGATLRSALKGAGLNPDTLQGAVTVNGDPADMAQRLRRDDFIAVTPKVAGGR